MSAEDPNASSTESESIEGSCMPPAAATPEPVKAALAAPVTAANRRTDNGRSAAQVPFEVILLTVANQPPLRIQSIDTSRNGMAFHAARPFLKDELLAVRLCFLNRPGKLVLCRARNCQKVRPGLYRVGVEFVEAISTAPGKRNVAVPAKWVALAKEELQNASPPSQEPTKS